MFSLFSLNPRISSTWFFYLQLGHSEIYHDILGYIGISLTNLTSPMAHLPNHSLKASWGPPGACICRARASPPLSCMSNEATQCPWLQHQQTCIYMLVDWMKRQLSFEQYLFNYVNWNSSLLQMSSRTARTPIYIYIRCCFNMMFSVRNNMLAKYVPLFPISTILNPMCFHICARLNPAKIIIRCSVHTRLNVVRMDFLRTSWPNPGKISIFSDVSNLFPRFDPCSNSGEILINPRISCVLPLKSWWRCVKILAKSESHPQRFHGFRPFAWRPHAGRGPPTWAPWAPGCFWGSNSWNG